MLSALFLIALAILKEMLRRCLVFITMTKFLNLVKMTVLELVVLYFNPVIFKPLAQGQVSDIASADTQTHCNCDKVDK